MRSLVVYREFPDGDDEIGVLTYEAGHFWVHVGDVVHGGEFDYCLSLVNPFYGNPYPFLILGEL